uniref:RNA-directed DNA polymerase n=1 Tax=Globodera rostochiensis TaxID=31243 RepID=A0A914HNL6_GLORO
MGLDWIVPFEQATQLAIATTLPFPQAPAVHAILQPTDDPTELAEQMKNSFPSVFQSGLGHCTKTKATLHLKSQAKPVFCRARPVPHGVLDVVDKELDRLLEIGAIKPVDFSRWAAPVLAVRKKSGAVRICIDFSTGLNEALELNRHPLPRTDDIFHALRGSKIFSQLDLRDAYLQMELDESSKSLVGINTHRGLFAYQRLPFGVKSAPSIFQKVMDQMIAGLPGVFAYLDDVIIASNTLTEHVTTLHQLFVKIQEYGFRIQMEKCHFLKKELRFLGHIVSNQGVRPDPARSAAIRDMPPPTDLSTLRSFLGALNYYGRFIKAMRELRGPLDVLLKKDTPWEWGEAQQAAFDKAKEVLQSDLLLTQYDPTKPIIVAADASQSGIGATISHKFPDGTERVIEHACRALSPAERNYAQIEREALALIFACQKFHRMIYGRKFTLLTDHKPLLAIFGNKKGIPIYTASRLQRWALILTNYDFTIQYVRSENFGQADVLSRLIAAQKTDEEAVIAYTSADQMDAADDVVEFVHLANMEPLPVDATEVSDHTAADELLQQVVTYVRSGWPQKGLGAELMPYFSRRNTLTCVGGSLLTGTRVVIPRPLRQRVLKTLHFAHPGITRMKALARRHVFWPGLDQEIEDVVRSCTECQLAAKLPTKAPLRPWPTPDGIFGRVHIDFAGPCWDGNTYLILVDALSKWPEIMQMNSTTAFSTTEALNNVFHRYGFPSELVSDNGRKALSILSRHPISRTATVKPNPSRTVNTDANRQQYRQHMKQQYDRRHGATERQFQIGDSVLALSYGNRNRPRWLEGQEWFQMLTDQTTDIRQGLQRLFSKGPRVRGRMYTPLHRHHVRQYRSTPRDHNVNGDHLFGSRPVDNEI